MSQANHRIRAILVRKLKANSGKKWTTIARESEVHLGTIKRWLAVEKARFEKIVLLAQALRSSADQLILPDGETDLTDYVDAEIVMPETRVGSALPQRIEQLLEEIHEACGGKFKVMLMYVGKGSVKLGIKLHVTDAYRLTKAFLRQQLVGFQIVTLHPVEQWPK
jgi:hypothetical protein